MSIKGFFLASDLVRPSPIKWDVFDGSKRITHPLTFGAIIEVVMCKEDLPSCVLDLILTFEKALKNEEIFILYTSSGNSLQPLLLHPAVSDSVVINGLVDSRSLKMQTISSVHELLQVLDTLLQKLESHLKVLLLLDDLDDLFYLWRRKERKETLNKVDLARKRKDYVARESLGRGTGQDSTLWPESDPFYQDGSKIPQTLDKLSLLLSTKNVVAVWIRTKHVGPRRFGDHLMEEERNGPQNERWKEGQVLWSPSLRHGPIARHDGKLPPFGEKWVKMVPTILTYATAEG